MLLKGGDLKDKTLLKGLETPTTSSFGFEYQIGKNTDVIGWDVMGDCKRGGLYFTDLETMCEFINDEAWVAMIKVEEDEPVYRDVKNLSYMAHSVIVTGIYRFKYCPFWSDPDACLVIVNQNGMLLKFVKHQTHEICMAAVDFCGAALEFVLEQTLEICMIAVNSCGAALEFVKKQTSEMCIIAVKENGCALEFVKDQTPEICMEAVLECGQALKFVKTQTPELCLAAVTQDEWAFDYVENPTQEVIDMCPNAVERARRRRLGIRSITEKICIAAVSWQGTHLASSMDLYETWSNK